MTPIEAYKYWVGSGIMSEDEGQLLVKMYKDRESSLKDTLRDSLKDTDSFKGHSKSSKIT